MELLEAREAELRRRVVGSTQSRGGVYASQTIIDRMHRVNAKLEQLNATIVGFARLSELYHVNRDLLRFSHTNIASAGVDVKRAVILSSEEQISSVVSEFQKLQELQQYIVQLERLHMGSSYAQSSIDRLEVTHTQQEERALVIHARVEKILGVYQEMMVEFLLVHVQVLSEKCVEYSAVLDQLLPASA